MYNLKTFNSIWKFKLIYILHKKFNMNYEIACIKNYEKIFLYHHVETLDLKGSKCHFSLINDDKMYFHLS